MLSPLIGRADCPGREPERPAGTGEEVSARIQSNHQSILQIHMETGHRSNRRNAGTGEGINARIHVMNSHGDRAKEGCKSEHRHSAISL